MNATRLIAMSILATASVTFAQEPPGPPPPPPPPAVVNNHDTVLVPVPAPDPAFTPAPLDPAPRYAYAEPAGRWLPASRMGFGMMLGGGVTNFFSDRANRAVDVGPEWAARLNVGTRSVIAGEAAYVGSTQRVQGLQPAQGQLLSNGAQGLLRVNILTSEIQPYVAAGLGWRRYQVIGYDQARVTSDIEDRADVGEVPAATGVALRGRGFIFDARFNVGVPFTRSAIRSVSGASATTWGATANLGFEF